MGFTADDYPWIRRTGGHDSARRRQGHYPHFVLAWLAFALCVTGVALALGAVATFGPAPWRMQTAGLAVLVAVAIGVLGAVFLGLH